MNDRILKGNILYCETPDRLRITENGFLIVENGICRGVFREIPNRFAAFPLEDHGNCLIVPGMTDLHLHAPQFAFRGLGMDMELLDWLNTYTFPEEAKYAEAGYAERAYDSFVRHLLRSTTARAVIFATVHTEATLLLMEKLEKTGLCTFVGRVNMDRNCPDSVREPSAEAALAETRRWLDACKGFQNTKPILTPRMIPACSDELMQGLGQLRREYDLPVQSHLSENFGEIAWVKELCPWSSCYGGAYDRFGMFGGDYPCIMAHCVHSDEREQALLKQNGVFVAHSPESNINLSSGAAPIDRYLDEGIRVGLATDVAAGSGVSMLRSMAYAVQASKLRWRLLDQDVKPLSFERAFYLATMGGGAFFGKVGTFEDGYAADAVVLDDSELEHPQPLSVRDRMERMLYLADERAVRAKYVQGRKVL